MKKLNLMLLVSLLSIVFLTNCSKDDETPTDNGGATNKPIVDFEADKTDIFQGDTVFFTTKNRNSTASWEWNFGDGGKSSTQNPFHVYATAGVYTVSLKGVNSVGFDLETKNDFITVKTSLPIDTAGTFIDNRDNKTYDWVRIGNQIWMTSNLKYNTNTAGCIAYNNDQANVDTYGYLYNWGTALIVAPDGWHLPSVSEYNELKNYLIDNEYYYCGSPARIAKALCTNTNWKITTSEPATPGNVDFPQKINISGFSAVPAGRYLYTDFSQLLENTYMWSSTETSYNTSKATSYGLQFNLSTFNGMPFDKVSFVSVRLIRD